MYSVKAIKCAIAGRRDVRSIARWRHTRCISVDVDIFETSRVVYSRKAAESGERADASNVGDMFYNGVRYGKCGCFVYGAGISVTILREFGCEELQYNMRREPLVLAIAY